MAASLRSKSRRVWRGQMDASRGRVLWDPRQRTDLLEKQPTRWCRRDSPFTGCNSAPRPAWRCCRLTASNLHLLSGRLNDGAVLLLLTFGCGQNRRRLDISSGDVVDMLSPAERRLLQKLADAGKPMELGRRYSARSWRTAPSTQSLSHVEAAGRSVGVPVQAFEALGLAPASGPEAARQDWESAQES